VAIRRSGCKYASASLHLSFPDCLFSFKAADCGLKPLIIITIKTLKMIELRDRTKKLNTLFVHERGKYLILKIGDTFQKFDNIYGSICDITQKTHTTKSGSTFKAWHIEMVYHPTGQYYDVMFPLHSVAFRTIIRSIASVRIKYGTQLRIELYRPKNKSYNMAEVFIGEKKLDWCPERMPSGNEECERWLQEHINVIVDGLYSPIIPAY